MAKTGRKLLPISAREVQNYARVGCTNREIADLFGCDEGTIRKRFSAELAKGRSDRREKLRRKQYEVAMKGNVTMLIWLGKNDLAQSDKPGGDDGTGDPEPHLDAKVG